METWRNEGRLTNSPDPIQKLGKNSLPTQIGARAVNICPELIFANIKIPTFPFK